MDADNSDPWFERATSRRVTRNSAVRHNLAPKRGQREFRRNFFSSRVIVTWNSQPEAVRHGRSHREQIQALYRRHLVRTVAPATRNT